MTSISYEQAELLRKEEKFLEAEIAFAEMWKNKPGPMIGWRLAFCYRKQGKLEDAKTVAKEALEKYPNDKWTKNELIWAIYDKEIKPAKDESDLGRAIHFGQEIMALEPDGLALHKTALAIMKVAKIRGKWDVVLQWADFLIGQNLSALPSEYEGKRGFSDLETWSVGRARALFELGKYDESVQFSQQSLMQLPNEIFLARTSALATAGLGDTQKAIDELRKLIQHPRADWYIKSDIAELERQNGNKQEAYRLICESLLDSRQGSEFKLGAFLTLSQLAVDLGDWNVAAIHIQLSKSIRDQEGWKIADELASLELQLRNLIKENGLVYPAIPENIRDLERLCKQCWQDGVSKGIERYTGTIKPYPIDRHFTFIKPDQGGDDIFVWVRDLPSKCSGAGSRVEYALKQSFDKKKNRDAVIAAYVKCVR